jgi:hypothetical protein
VAHKIASSFTSGVSTTGSPAGQSHALIHDVQLAYAHSTQTVFYIMAGVLAATFIVALRRVPAGIVKPPEEMT